jgi:hypothetical protein
MPKIVKCGKLYRQQLLAGDAIALVAQPIARGIDAMAHRVGLRSNVSGCSGCKARRAKLNARLGNINPLASKS